MRIHLLPCLWSILLLSSALVGKGPIQVRDNFESGNLGTWRVEQETRLIVIPRTDSDQDRINTAVTWFYGRLSNVLNREVSIELEGLDYTVYNGQLGTALPFERGTAPVFSYDREHWERFTDCSFDRAARTFRIRQIFSRDPVWIAYVPPYTLTRLESLLAEIREHPDVVVETLGRSVEGRPLYLVTVGQADLDPGLRPVTWIVARQHAFETGGSWAVEGLLRFLISEEAEAQTIRRKITFKVCPMMNPDGVVRGKTRFNAVGVDLNRHWRSEDPFSRDWQKAPEIAALKQRVLRWRETNRLDLWINIHNNDMVWNEDGDYIRFAPREREIEARRLENYLRQETVFTGPFELSRGEQTTEVVVAAETGALSLLMEMKTGFLEGQDRWTGVDVFLAHGRGLARAVFRLLEHPSQESPAPGQPEREGLFD